MSSDGVHARASVWKYVAFVTFNLAQQVDHCSDASPVDHPDLDPSEAFTSAAQPLKPKPFRNSAAR